MRKFYLFTGCVFIAAAASLFLTSPKTNFHSASFNIEQRENNQQNEEYDGPEKAEELEFQKTYDHSLGYIPYDRLRDAIAATELSKNSASLSRTTATLNWETRGPIYDSVGPSNGNTGGGK